MHGQAGGREGADLYRLGVILYEMLDAQENISPDAKAADLSRHAHPAAGRRFPRRTRRTRRCPNGCSQSIPRPRYTSAARSAIQITL